MQRLRDDKLCDNTIAARAGHPAAVVEATLWEPGHLKCSGYLLFSRRVELGPMAVKSRSKQVGAMWRELPPAEKAELNASAAAASSEAKVAQAAWDKRLAAVLEKNAKRKQELAARERARAARETESRRNEAERKREAKRAASRGAKNPSRPVSESARRLAQHNASIEQALKDRLARQVTWAHCHWQLLEPFCAKKPVARAFAAKLNCAPLALQPRVLSNVEMRCTYLSSLRLLRPSGLRGH